MNEQQILAAMASADPAERAMLNRQLIQMRAAHRAATQAQSEAVLGSQAVEYLTPGVENMRHSAATDWIDRVVPADRDYHEVRREAEHEAQQWLATKSALVRSDPDELGAQAMGYARLWGGRFGESMNIARASFMRRVASLVKVSVTPDYEDVFEEDRQARVKADADADSKKMAGVVDPRVTTVPIGLPKHPDDNFNEGEWTTSGTIDQSVVIPGVSTSISTRKTGSFRIQESPGIATGNTVYTLQFMPSDEDSAGYGMWEDVKTFPTREGAEGFIANPEPWFGAQASLKTADRNRQTHPQYGDQTACRVCGMDIEYHGPQERWVGRGGDHTCAGSGAHPVDENGVSGNYPDTPHQPMSDRLASRKTALSEDRQRAADIAWMRSISWQAPFETKLNAIMVDGPFYNDDDYDEIKAYLTSKYGGTTVSKTALMVSFSAPGQGDVTNSFEQDDLHNGGVRTYAQDYADNIGQPVTVSVAGTPFGGTVQPRTASRRTAAGNYYVQVNRLEDGSRTYKGPYLSPADAQREADAWNSAESSYEGRGWNATIVEGDEDFKAWQKATWKKNDWEDTPRYFPTASKTASTWMVYLPGKDEFARRVEAEDEQGAIEAADLGEVSDAYAIKLGSKTAADYSAIEAWCDRQGLVMKDFPDSLIEQAAATDDTSILEEWLEGNEPYTDISIGDNFDRPSWTGSRHTAGNPYPVGSSMWFDWDARLQAGEQPEGSGPYSSGAPGGGIPLHGPLSPEQEAWMKRRSSVTAGVGSPDYQRGYDDGMKADWSTNPASGFNESYNGNEDYGDGFNAATDARTDRGDFRNPSTKVVGDGFVAYDDPDEFLSDFLSSRTAAGDATTWVSDGSDATDGGEPSWTSTAPPMETQDHEKLWTDVPVGSSLAMRYADSRRLKMAGINVQAVDTCSICGGPVGFSDEGGSPWLYTRSAGYWFHLDAEGWPMTPADGHEPDIASGPGGYEHPGTNRIGSLTAVYVAPSPEDAASRPWSRGEPWSLTCPICGKTETGTDYYNGWPSQDAFHNHLFCGHDPDADYHQDLAIDRYSSRLTAADSTGSWQVGDVVWDVVWNHGPGTVIENDGTSITVDWGVEQTKGVPGSSKTMYVNEFDNLLRRASRRTAADEGGQTCSVCGDKIEKNPGEDGYHHDNGEKHDHEAKPGSSKESSLGDALPFGTNARFINHQGFVGIVRATLRDYFDCELELSDGRLIGAKWYELEAVSGSKESRKMATLSDEELQPIADAYGMTLEELKAALNAQTAPWNHEKYTSKMAVRQIPISEVHPGDVLVQDPDSPAMPERDTVQAVDSIGGGLFIIDFANGTSTAPMGNGLVYVAAFENSPANTSTEKVVVTDNSDGIGFGWVVDDEGDPVEQDSINEDHRSELKKDAARRTAGDMRPATESEERAWQSGYIDIPGAVETIDGLMVPMEGELGENGVRQYPTNDSRRGSRTAEWNDKFLTNADEGPREDSTTEVVPIVGEPADDTAMFEPSDELDGNWKPPKKKESQRASALDHSLFE